MYAGHMAEVQGRGAGIIQAGNCADLHDLHMVMAVGKGKITGGGRLLAFPSRSGGGGGGFREGRWGGGGVGVVVGAGGGTGSPYPPSNHTIAINLTLTFAASWFGHASHVDRAEQDPPNFVHSCFATSLLCILDPNTHSNLSLG